MAHRKIKWSSRAVKEVEKILSFWFYKNRSGTYSNKLNNSINSVISLIAEQPTIGRAIDKKYKIFYSTHRLYRICYTYTSEELIILCIWDNRRNPDKFKI